MDRPMDRLNVISSGPLGVFDFSGKLNHNLRPIDNEATTKTLTSAPSTPILIKKPFKHVSSSAPSFSLKKQILLQNAHLYEKGNANLVHSIIGSNQPLVTSNDTSSEMANCKKNTVNFDLKGQNFHHFE